jgi:hypothetical protein
MERADVDRWLEAYVRAWKSYRRKDIEALFAADVQYRYHPYDDPLQGRDAVVAAWLGEDVPAGASGRDEPGTYEATYHAIAVDGDVAVATGTSSYRTKPGGPFDKAVFDNCFVMKFDAEGRCREFTEWFMQRPAAK